MLDAQVFIGLPLNFKGKFKVYPPKVKDVLSNDNFHQMARILTITQEDIMDDYKNRLYCSEYSLFSYGKIYLFLLVFFLAFA